MISIIIPCYNAEKYIKPCLKSILNSKAEDYEIIVVDDNSTDRTTKILSTYSKNQKVKIIMSKSSQGPAKRRNQAVKQAQGKLLFFLDVDTIVSPNTLKHIKQAFQKNKELGAGQAKLILPDKKKLDSIGHYLSPIGFPYEIGSQENPDQYTDKKTILAGKTAGLVVRKEVFNNINGFDPDYFIYGEDTDLCWRIWLAGYTINYLPEVEVVHFQKSSLTKKSRHLIYYEGAKNNISNLIKNMSFPLILIVTPLHILSWLCLSLRMFFQGNTNLALKIYQGIFWNLKNIKRTLNKRKNNTKYIKTMKLPKKILFGPTTIKELFFKGIAWLKDV